MNKKVSSIYSFFERQNIFSLYILYLFLILISSIVFCSIYSNYYEIVDVNNNIILKNIDFGHGQLIHNFYYDNNLSQQFNGLDFYLKKTLALPLIIYFLAKISLNFIFIISTKNIIMYSLYFWICYLFIKINRKNFFIFTLILIVPIIVPYNYQVSLNFNYEDNLIAIILPIIYLLVVGKKNISSFYLISFFLFFAYFCKTSMFFIVIITPLLLIFFEKNSYLKFIPSFGVMLAIVIWGVYGLQKTGKFPIGPSGSTYNTYVMSFSLNERFHEFYPKYSTDLIGVEKPTIEIKDEWEFYDYYKKKNSIYLKDNLNQFLQDILLKINFIFFNIYKDGKLDLYSEDKIKIDNIINRIIINFTILTFLFIFFKKFKITKKFHFIMKDEYKINFYFIFLFILSIAPHLIVWATSKHLVGIINVSLIYLILIYEKNINNFLKKNSIGK